MYDRICLTVVIVAYAVALPCVVGCSGDSSTPDAGVSSEVSGSSDSKGETKANPTSDASSSALGFKTRSDVPDQSWRHPPEPRRYPSISDAIGTLPPWLLNDKNAPFDVAEYAETPAWEDNAAPLYLDALYEFSWDRVLETCFPKDERTRRTPITRARGQRFDQLYTPWEKNRRSVDAAAFAPILKEYEIGFQKLKAAQQKQRCVIERGAGFTALHPHAHFARSVARVATVRAWSELQKGNIDAAIQDAATTFRLGRDIAHRGDLISALVSMGIDAIVCDILRDVLLHPKLKIEQCDRLLSMLGKHEKFHNVVWRRAWQGEYVSVRVILHDLQYRAGDFSPEGIKVFGIKTMRGRTFGQITAMLLESLKDLKNPLVFADHIDSMTDADFEREVSIANASFKSLLDLFKRPVFERRKQASQLEDRMKSNSKSKLSQLFFPHITMAFESARRGSTRLAAFKALICIRRWQLEHSGAAPPDLATALKAAGITEPVVDGYGKGESLRFTTIGGNPVVYSIGPDGKDDNGLKEWTHDPKQSGDWTFRIESGAAAESRREAAVQ